MPQVLVVKHAIFIRVGINVIDIWNLLCMYELGIVLCILMIIVIC